MLFLMPFLFVVLLLINILPFRIVLPRIFHTLRQSGSSLALFPPDLSFLPSSGLLIFLLLLFVLYLDHHDKIGQIFHPLHILDLG